MEGNSSLAKNAVYKTILNICNIIIPIIVGPYVLRVLDRSYYDLFNVLNADFAILLVIGGFGVYIYGVREISRIRDDKDKVNKLFSELFIIGIITNTLVMLGYIVATFFLQDSQLKIYLCLILSIQFLGNVFNVEWINEANENYRFIALKSICVRIVYLVCIFIFVRHADDIIAYTLLLIASTFLNTFASFLYIKRKNKIVLKGINLKKHFVPLFIVFVISNISILYAQLDKVMLGKFVNASSVSSYQISQYISSLIYNLLLPIVTVAVPRLAKIFTKDKQECFNLHTQVFNSFLALSVPAIMGAALLSKEIVLLYGGEVYIDCVTPLTIYCVAQFISAGCYIFGDALLYVTGHERELLITNLIGGITNISLNFLFILIGIFTTEMAVVSISVAYALVSVLDFLIIRKKLGYKIKVLNRHSLLYLGAASLFIPIILLIKHFELNIFLTVGLSVVSCIIVYFGAVFLFKDSIFMSLISSILAKIRRRKSVSNEEANIDDDVKNNEEVKEETNVDGQKQHEVKKEQEEEQIES